MPRYWIVVASASHARRGVAGGFVQANHGKLAPMKRMQPGDGVLIYSPTEEYGGKDKLQAFTGVGFVASATPYEAEMAHGMMQRRDVVWNDVTAAPIRPLLDALDFTRGVANWGQKFRFGMFEIAEADFALIKAAMIG